MNSINTNAAAIKTLETAATRTSSIASLMPNMRRGRLSVRALDRNSETGTLSIKAVKVGKVLGGDVGRDQRQGCSVYNNEAPSCRGIGRWRDRR